MNRVTNGVRAELYPEIEPYNAGLLALDGRHRMYFEESGNPRGAPDESTRSFSSDHEL